MTSRPRPIADAVSGFYWDAARRGELAVLRCDACTRLHHPPDVACPHCGATAVRPATMSGRGVVYASTVVRQPFDRSFADAVPFVVALVELEEQPGVRILTNLLDVADAVVAPGTPVALSVEQYDDWALPQFRVVQP